MKDEIVMKRMYEKGHTMTEIAQHFGTYPKRIKRILQKEGVKFRDRSEVQSLLLSTGKRAHPTKGKRRSQEVREKISSTMASMWDTMDEGERSRRSEVAKELWHSKSDEEMKEFRTRIVRAAKNGSKLEKEIMVALRLKGYNPLFHAKNLVENQNLHVDIFLPEQKIAIEIDGPSHFEPIWGDEALERQRKADTAKNGLLIGKGIRVLRIQADKNTVKFRAHIMKKIEEFLTSSVQLEHVWSKDG